jgi:hypothetical protein
VFDTSVLTNPDYVYERIKKDADPGFCDHSFISTQAATEPRR